jgi:phosphoglycolate phosphatase-like HAD superfamily hydrolase
MGKAVIFDFDGTLADTFRVGLDIFYKLTKRGKIPKGEMDRLRGMNFRHAVGELKIPVWKAPVLLFRGRRELRRRIGEVELFYGVPELIQQLSEQGYELHIISLNSSRNIRKLLEMHGLDGYFTSIRGNVRFWGKASVAKSLLNRYGHDNSDAVYIGDEIRDVHAARAAHIKVIAVTWGYNNVHVLHESKPDKIVFDPSEVPAALEELLG